MALAPGAVLNVSGSLTNPKCTRLAIIGHTLESNGTSKQMVNVLDFWCPTPLPGGALATFITSYQGFTETLYLACLSIDYTIDAYVAKYLDNPLSIPAVLPVSASGGVSGDRAASFTSGVIQKNTTVPSRNFRGAMHIGALSESFTTKDILNSTGTAAYNPLASALTGLVTSGVSDGAQAWFPIILSTTLSNLFAAPAIFSYAPIVTFTTNLTIGTMKRRKEKRAV